MSIRHIVFVAGASLTVAGCASDRSITSPPPATALVRFINATNTGTDIAISGLVSTTNTNIASLGASGCLTVNAAAPALSFRSTGTSTDIAGFTASFTAGHKYWVVAITGPSATQFVTLDMAFTPAAPTSDIGLAGLNAVSGGGPYDLHVTVPGTTLSGTTVKISNLAFGVSSPLLNTTLPFNTAAPPVAQPLQLQFTNTGSLTVQRNHGNVTFVPNTSDLAIVVSGAAATPTTLRSIVNAGC